MNEFEKEMLELYRKSLGEKQDFHGIVCPATFKKPCRLCDLCKEVLFNRSIPKEAPLRKRASSLNAKQHYFSNVLFLTDPAQVVVFEYGDKIFKQLLAMQMNGEQGFQDFWHPIAGRWLIIERIQGATREQVDYYVKPKDPSKISDMSVLSNMYNLSEIPDLVKDGKVKPIYQSKLEKTSIIRILPSWLGPEFAMKFFQKVDYHFNISEDDFKACMAGEINPVRINGGEEGPSPKTAMEKVDERMVKETAARGGWGTAMPSPGASVSTPDTKVQTTHKSTSWDFQEKPLQKEVHKANEEPTVDEDELPPCYGDYDQSAPDCSPRECPDWSDGCKAYREERLAKRRTAKRLSR